MKNLRFTFIILVIIITLYQLPNFVGWLLGHSMFRQIHLELIWVELLSDAFGMLITLLFFISITYKKWWDGNTFKRLVPAIGFVTALLFTFFLIKETYRSFRAIDKLYSYYKKNTGVLGNVFMADDTLGHRGVPNGAGNTVFALTNAKIEVPIQLDEAGYRIATERKKARQDSLMMFLGCSFTWGDYVLAEQNYASLMADSLHYEPLNCGVDAYGLAQMLVLAERNIVKYHPKVLSVQYSPWLADRARFMFYPTIYGEMPYPFFTGNDKHELALHLPYFRSSLYNPTNRLFKTSPVSFSDKVSFFFKVGVPMLVDTWKKQGFFLGMRLGIVPSSEPDNMKIEQYVYQRIYQLCKEKGVKMVIVNIGGFGSTNEERMANHYDRKRFNTSLPSLVKEVSFIDADSVLRAEIKSNETYSKYVHWGKNSLTDSTIYDNHPNPMAHQIIAKTLVKGIRN